MSTPVTPSAPSLCGVWVDDDGRVQTTIRTADGGRETQVRELRPFAWLGAPPPDKSGIKPEALAGAGPFQHLVHADSLAAYQRFLRDAKEGNSLDYVRPLESQFLDRKSTRLNSSHLGISYAVFCLKKKKKKS